MWNGLSAPMFGAGVSEDSVSNVGSHGYRAWSSSQPRWSCLYPDSNGKALPIPRATSSFINSI